MVNSLLRTPYHDAQAHQLVLASYNGFATRTPGVTGAAGRGARLTGAVRRGERLTRAVLLDVKGPGRS